MAAFEYIALDAGGRRQKGTLSADSERAARRELRMRQLTPLSVAEAGGGQASGKAKGRGSGRRIRSRDRVLVTRQLAMLIRAGTPVEEALHAVASQAERADVRALLLSVRSSVTEGFRLAEAMAEHPKVFNPLYRAIVSAGEASGHLGEVLERLAVYLEGAQKVQRKVMGAVTYPIVLACVAILVVIALMVVIVPRVVEQFDTLGGDLPALTRFVIGVSEFLQSNGLILGIAIAAGAVLLGNALRAERVRRVWDRLWLRLPLFGRMTRIVNASRFSRTFATLVGSGATALDSLAAAKGATTNLVFRDAVSSIEASVREGTSLSRAMRKTGVFPPMLVTLAASGEQSGEQAAMMGKGADYLDEEFEASTGVALSLLEPLIIVFLGGVVVVIVLAIMLPILQLNASLT